MKQVKNIPAPAAPAIRRDPWLDKVLDGTLRLLSEADWQDRYRTPRSAASAIHQAAQKRGIRATVAIRGTDLYVQGLTGPANNGTKAAAKRVPARKKAAPAAKRPAKVA